MHIKAQIFLYTEIREFQVNFFINLNKYYIVMQNIYAGEKVA